MSSIFKYMPYRSEFLTNFFLKISCFGEFNDPFEMVMGSYLSSVDKSEFDLHMSCSPVLSDPASYYDFYCDARCGVRASLGVLCFTSKKDNLLMWAHYANNHTGICIEFDKNAKFFNGQYKNAKELFGKKLEDNYQNIGELRKVKYGIERPSYIDPRELEYDTECWFAKSIDWEYEQEERLLLPLELAETYTSSTGTNIFGYRVCPNIIKSIILGCNMSCEDKAIIAEQCKIHGIKVQEAYIHAHQYKLDIVDYDENNHSSYINEYNLNRISKW